MGALVARVRASADANHGRFLLGIAGPPGAGKTTLALALRDALNEAETLATGVRRPIAEIAPMDGYHLTNAMLRTKGTLARKGEPDTFDTAAYLDSLLRLRTTSLGNPVPWPTFDRAVDDPIPAGVVFARQRIVITEGNYLLLDDFAGKKWSSVRGLLSQAWYLDAAREAIEERLFHRHVRGGRTPEAALAKVRQSDLRNAQLIAATRHHADLILRGCQGGYQLVGGADAR
ncbi:nucleoside triphosphate hydrolase [Nocardia callitridis]|uniref:Nucleoside triphosphate hydrolase n=2 Tax=Nocardia callitridis TaxID=648753 RepID=A0ABP9JTD9_9NOCA